jgi:hypothetical protein
MYYSTFIGRNMAIRGLLLATTNYSTAASDLGKQKQAHRLWAVGLPATNSGPSKFLSAWLVLQYLPQVTSHCLHAGRLS